MLSITRWRWEPNGQNNLTNTYFTLQSLRFLFSFECNKSITFADARSVNNDFRGLDIAIGRENTTQLRFRSVTTTTKEICIECIIDKTITNMNIMQHNLMPPTKIRFGISVPYLGADNGVSSWPAAALVRAMLFMLLIDSHCLEDHQRKIFPWRRTQRDKFSLSLSKLISWPKRTGWRCRLLCCIHDLLKSR